MPVIHLTSKNILTEPNDLPGCEYSKSKLCDTSNITGKRWKSSCYTQEFTEYLLTYIIYHVTSFLDCEVVGEDETMTDSQFANLPTTHNEVIGNCNFKDIDFVRPGALDPTSAVEPNIGINDGRDTDNNDGGRLLQDRRRGRNFETILEIFRGAAGGFTTYCDYLNSSQGEDNDDEGDGEHMTIAGVARDLAKTHNRQLDEKQYITYEIICCSFLLAQLDETGDQHNIIQEYITEALKERRRNGSNTEHGVTAPFLSTDQQSSLNTVKKLLKSRGGKSNFDSSSPDRRGQEKPPQSKQLRHSAIVSACMPE